MPLVRASGKLIYFAHVPKCGGTAVERYLQARFGPLGFWDPLYAMRSDTAAWTRSPPQHMPEIVRRDLVPDTLLDAKFTIVRHPYRRLRSVFMFQKMIEGAIPRSIGFVRWLDIVTREIETNAYRLHGHLQPMSHFVPKAAQVFRLEDGLDAIVPWLDAVTESSDGPRTITPANVLTDRLHHEGHEPPAHAEPGSEALEKVARIYAGDFERFGYSADPAAGSD